MLEPSTYANLAEAIEACVEGDRELLDALRREIAPLKASVHRIQPRRATAVSLVATDGGNNQLRFDPFLIQLVRVVDSQNNEYCLEVVTPNTPHEELEARHLDPKGKGKTPLGRMMEFLGVRRLQDLSPMLRPPSPDRPVSPSWVGVYRELMEWAILFDILKKDFASDTLLIFDGLLRSKVFAKGLFTKLLEGIEARIQEQRKNRRNLYLVGMAKRSKVLDRYRLAMRLEGVLDTPYPAYVEVPRDVEKKAYIWSEYARGNEVALEGEEVNRMVGGKMFLVKFGASRYDPIWPVDIFEPQRNRAQEILGYLLADAQAGFPVLHYPASLQKAHESAALVDFDFQVLQDKIFAAIRKSLREEAGALDVFHLQDADPARRRY
ncbi:hypothetical protein CSW39_02255 [Thermus scotoductus]|uniref:NurA domain-containing protein n=1 Tax=Thermus scotoductus TaxID=37636 RepID=A0A430S7A6_THESC|nr:hypothetical protein [Thermus scotoductus]RTG92563.1 hypothetical protein CSW48_12695 [Thermus scotoductus]RTH07307.1 hypothetical protein CSW46_10475 [Thermus scotoductus]RTH09755.1 hypothetical protein CSW44_08325 [Thermus scotoductus]RTH09842.1 hypothetical protein CSW43_10380 [Thermus scotoductus]RTH19613.1 hypothetical protein CSW39_02255 [Thermus scotoductus]